MEAISQALSIYNKQTSVTKNIFKICGVSCIYLLVRSIYIKLYRKYKLLPPGPIGYPILGVLPSMVAKGPNFHIDMARNNKICSLPLGSLPVFMINNDKLIKELLSIEQVHWRPPNMTTLEVPPSFGDLHGGSDWKQRRKLFQTNLITMLNKKYLDENVKILLNKFLFPKLDKIAEQINNNQNIWHWSGDFQYLTFNIIHNCIFGDYIEQNDPLYIQYLKDFRARLEAAGNYFALYILFGEKITTFLRKNILSNTPDFIVAKQYEKCKKWSLKAHEKYDENNLKTYYDYIYNKLSKQYSSNDVKYDDIITTEVLSDFEIAIEGGTDTTASTLEYCIVAAAKNPNVQEAIYKELDKVFNLSSRNIEDIDIFDNIQSLHNLRAFIFESLRLNPVAPATFRQIKKKGGITINVDGNKYILPDNTIIMPNILGMQRNPKLWKNADKFNMNRWLDKDGKFNRKLNPTLMSFSFGIRDCPGRTLALKTLYLVPSILFIKYKFYFDEPDTIENKKKLDFVLHIDPEIPCKICKRERQ